MAQAGATLRHRAAQPRKRPTVPSSRKICSKNRGSESCSGINLFGVAILRLTTPVGIWSSMWRNTFPVDLSSYETLSPHRERHVCSEGRAGRRVQCRGSRPSPEALLRGCASEDHSEKWVFVCACSERSLQVGRCSVEARHRVGSR